MPARFTPALCYLPAGCSSWARLVFVAIKKQKRAIHIVKDSQPASRKYPAIRENGFLRHDVAKYGSRIRSSQSMNGYQLINKPGIGRTYAPKCTAVIERVVLIQALDVYTDWQSNFQHRSEPCRRRGLQDGIHNQRNEHPQQAYPTTDRPCQTGNKRKQKHCQLRKHNKNRKPQQKPSRGCTAAIHIACPVIGIGHSNPKPNKEKYHRTD